MSSSHPFSCQVELGQDVSLLLRLCVCCEQLAFEFRTEAAEERSISSLYMNLWSLNNLSIYLSTSELMTGVVNKFSSDADHAGVSVAAARQITLKPADPVKNVNAGIKGGGATHGATAHGSHTPTSFYEFDLISFNLFYLFALDFKEVLNTAPLRYHYNDFG
ncbi:hypothetical protein E2C01_039067 [Portunus trituberculatus]|uniref:Uncharacterized protein n=1 Tax=Portunus trituberculatus TaxID=210409 RepID=A0A5B7FJN1_PORTR|nr:hypothetical protein [Portunus trituberculatus]